MDYFDNRFKEGQDVQCIMYPDDSSITVGVNGVERISVIMEDGQMAGVPWFAVWKEGKIVYKHNGAHLASVNL